MASGEGRSSSALDMSGKREKLSFTEPGCPSRITHHVEADPQGGAEPTEGNNIDIMY
jgi:hypothetical protein